MQFHFYADDTQLNISFSTNNDMELTNSITKIEECLSDINQRNGNQSSQWKIVTFIWAALTGLRNWNATME